MGTNLPHRTTQSVPSATPVTRPISEEATPPHGNSAESGGRRKPSKCPVATEFQQVRAHHSVLASTGCTKDFCQAGRAVHTDEPRIGENRAIENVEKEAEGFLRELHREDFFDTVEAFEDRLKGVLSEIRAGSREGLIRESQKQGVVGGDWLQTPAELEFGIRRAWRNARKCIMRSHCDELKLCDLRSVTTSNEMASELVLNMCEAFNGGNVLPTVFLFPPHKVNSRGPMIWNHQVLEFAGYEMDDGSILGDPMSAALTKSIIELGWEPPSPRTRWDLLPLVVMADSDVPVMIEIPSPLCDLVHIQHPRYDSGFKKLELRWVAVPALTRLGFDIGGVQYTAAPFMGWFMDAEIGVRDLADTFRYNMLPDIARGLGLLDVSHECAAEDLEDLPEYERLSILSRAQTELTYAVYWSYQQAKISISDSLTASMKWCRYDDEFKAKNGFRLPADPYWLAPPQGSIIPAWHRGGAPNYQPKPMISRHVQDPLKAWEREQQEWFVAAKPFRIVAKTQSTLPRLQGRSTTNHCVSTTCIESHLRGIGEPLSQQQTQKPTNALPTNAEINKVLVDRHPLSVSVYFCSAGTFAEKTAVKLHGRLSDLSRNMSDVSVCSCIKPLNQFKPSSIRADEIILAIVSSTGQGEVPANGSQFIKTCDEILDRALEIPTTSFRYAVYGNGDSRYSATYNGAAVTIDQKLRQIGGLAFAGGLYQGDTALHATALQALTPWWTKLQPAIRDLATDSPKLRRAYSVAAYGNVHVTESRNSQLEAKSRLKYLSEQLLRAYGKASVLGVSPSLHEGYQGTYLVTLDIKGKSYEDLNCIQLLPINAPAKVRRALRALGVSASDRLSLGVLETGNPTYSVFLTELIDLESPFHDFEWLESLLQPSTMITSDVSLSSLSSLDALESLHNSGILPANLSLTNSICLALPPLHPRTYSVASSLSYTYPSPFRKLRSWPSIPSHNCLDILVKPFPQGRFSHAFLTSPTPTPLRYRLLPSSASSLLALPYTTPLIIIATGAGFAPVRCLLQRRIAISRASSSDLQSSISLFLGLKPADVPLLSDVLNEAAAAGLIDSMSIVSSNEGKVRVYDKLLEEATCEKIRQAVDREGWVFVCTNPEAAKGTRAAFEEVLGEGGIDSMGGRWVEEIF